LIFPEIDVEKIDTIRGLQVTISTSAATDKEAYELLKLMGMPFKEKTN
jgi:large subunit ribosomal protein L5